MSVKFINKVRGIRYFVSDLGDLAVIIAFSLSTFFPQWVLHPMGEGSAGPMGSEPSVGGKGAS